MAVTTGWHYAVYSALLLIVFSTDAERRDPFQTEEAISCQRKVKKEMDWLSSWQLRGIIRRENVAYGWVKTPEGQWVALNGDLPLSYWRLLNVKDEVAIFSSVPLLKSRCRPNDIIELTLGK